MSSFNPIQHQNFPPIPAPPRLERQVEAQVLMRGPYNKLIFNQRFHRYAQPIDVRIANLLELREIRQVPSRL
jgi:hypothetical protein